MTLINGEKRNFTLELTKEQHDLLEDALIRFKGYSYDELEDQAVDDMLDQLDEHGVWKKAADE